jgi:transglutaminase-like putative cysteine protease
MRLRVHHTTTYRYQPAASGVIQVLRLTPGNHDGQYVADWQVDLSTDSHLSMRRDAFGNITHVFTADGPLTELVVHVDGNIETQDTGGVLKGTDERFPPSLFLRATPLTQPGAALSAFATELRAPFGNEALGFLHQLMRELNTTMVFDTDPTSTGTSANEAFALRRGVCQDYAHIFIACARAAGVPARYVAGHFMRADGVVQQEAGHAWAEAHVDDLGWIGFDPANGISTTDAHARIAIGLDYLGAAPVRGTRYGGGIETLAVAVSVDQASRQNQA